MTALASAIRAPRVAVFVDGENLPADHAAAILALAAEAGPVDWHRVYGDVTRMPQWQAVPGFRVVHSRTGKNAADMLIAIEAMERTLTGACQNVVIASSDGDFTCLAQRLRELGVTVLGIGEAKAPAQFRLACTRFHELVGASVPAKTEAGPDSAPQTAVAGPTQLDRQIRAIIIAGSVDGTGMMLGALGAKITSQHGVKIKEMGFANWRKYLEGKSALYDLDPSGKDARVRVLAKGF
jgi:hypothetical protein